MDDGQRHTAPPAGDFVINTTKIDEAEHSLSALFGAICINTPRPQRDGRTQIWRSYIGNLAIDDVEFTFDMDYVMEPPDSVLLCRVRSGVLEETPDRQPSHRHGTGAVVAFGAVG